jgi:nucleoside permease NupC
MRTIRNLIEWVTDGLRITIAMAWILISFIAILAIAMRIFCAITGLDPNQTNEHKYNLDVRLSQPATNTGH